MKREDYRLLSFWSFNGEMKDEEIREQIHQFHDQGYGGFFMHARAGMTLEYLGKDWFHACLTAVEEAEKLGLKAWLYDENGWPSGFAGGLVPALGEAYTAKHLYFINHEPGKWDTHVMAEYKRCEDGSYVKLKEDSKESADLYCCMGQLKGYADLLNPEAMRAFINFTHEKYKEELGEYFGNVIPGIFTDEPQLVGKFPFTFSYPELFKKTYGYDFFEKAWMLCMDDLSCAAFKHQAAKLVGEMLAESFTGQLNRWCLDNHLEFTGHFSNEDGLCDQVNANYHLMKQYGRMERPGIDFLGRRLTSPVLVKQVSDASYLAGKDRILSESFGCCGWDVNFNDLMWIADWQAAFGINTIVTHLSAYSMKGRRKRDYPAFFSYQEPWWDIFGEVSSHIRKVNEFLGEGRREIGMLVVYPITSMWCVLAGSKRSSDEARLISNQFRLLIENLLDLQKEFLLVTEEEFSKFEIKEDRLCREDISSPLVMIPDSISLLDSTYDKLQNLGEQNGRIAFINRKPILCEGNPSSRADLVNGKVVENRRGLLEKYLFSEKMTDEITVVNGVTGRIAEGIILARRLLEDQQRVFVMNPSKMDTKKLCLKVQDKIWNSFELAPTESRMFKITSSLPEKTAEYQKRIVSDLDVEKVELLSPNAYTINRCDVYLNEKCICRQVLPAACSDELYEAAYKSGEKSKVRLVYGWKMAFEREIPENITLVAEGEGLLSLKVNGKDILEKKNGWWIDKSFESYQVSSFVKNGMNTAELEFEIVRPKELEEQGDFEGYKNRFFYPIEPEDIYLYGDFDVHAEEVKEEGIETFTTGNLFELTDMDSKIHGELTHQNLWFYRGNVRFTSTFETEYSKAAISLKDFYGTAAEIVLNGKKMGTISRSPYKLDISQNLCPGKNILEIILYGSNRNLLGPHHHKSRNPHFVGIPTFLGQHGWTDFVYPEITEENTHVEDYSFVKLSCGRILLEETVGE